jgi:uncharacterized protein YodC (DUF2158 family)
MDKFKAGDLVRLKSGGPVMVVETVWEPLEYECQWFNDGALCKGRFMDDVLEAVESDTIPMKSCKT